MFNYTNFFTYLNDIGLGNLSQILQDKSNKILSDIKNGDLPRWNNTLQNLPELIPSNIDLNSDIIQIGNPTDIAQTQVKQFKNDLLEFHPWRKGPFELFGTHIDTEWHSDWKWNRLKNKISSLKDKLVLDIGCGSGYHCFRMLGEEAKCVLGIEPYILYAMQSLVINKYLNSNKLAVLPLKVEDMPLDLICFDTVFSMGVIYHRKDPLEHIETLKSFLKPSGQIVLETIIIESDKEEVLVPKGRYARMRNVWNLPSVPMLKKWFTECNLKNIQVIDVTTTSLEEQRATDWMYFESLKECLDQDNSNLTVEGYPAPVRAVIIAEK